MVFQQEQFPAELSPAEAEMGFSRERMLNSRNRFEPDPFGDPQFFRVVARRVSESRWLIKMQLSNRVYYGLFVFGCPPGEDESRFPPDWQSCRNGSYDSAIDALALADPGHDTVRVIPRPVPRVIEQDGQRLAVFPREQVTDAIVSRHGGRETQIDGRSWIAFPYLGDD